MKSTSHIFRNIQAGYKNSGVKIGYYVTIGSSAFSALLSSFGAPQAAKFPLMGTGAFFICALLNHYKAMKDILKRKNS